MSGQSVVGGTWNWGIAITNTGTDPVVFTHGQKVLKDDLPSSGLSYGVVTDASANLTCSIAASTLTCTASGTLTIAANSLVNVTVPVTANDAGSYTNPRAAGVCGVDPDGLVQTEANEANNSCGPDTVVVSAASTTTSITADLPDPSTPGEDVTVQYTVSGAGTVTGSVVVTDSLGDDTCTATVAAGQCTLDDLTTEGTHTLTATYLGSTNHNGSPSAGVSHLVAKLTTNTSIDSDTPDPSLIGTAVDVDYTVSGAGTPVGNVTVSDGVDSCTGTVAAGTCSITLTTAGSRTLTAEYEGDATHDGSTSLGEPHQVNKIATTTTIDTDTPDPSAVGAAVTVEYTVTGAPGTANVTVSDGVDSCTGTVTAAQCSITLTTAGSRTLTATYAGDATHDDSSDTEGHLVNGPPTIEVLAGGRCSSTTLATVKLSIVDPDGDALTVTAVTSNVAIATGALGGSGANRTLAVTAKKLGTATITVSVSDGNGGSRACSSPFASAATAPRSSLVVPGRTSSSASTAPTRSRAAARPTTSARATAPARRRAATATTRSTGRTATTSCAARAATTG